MEDVRALYAERLAARRGAAERAGSRARWISNARLVGFGLAVALCWPVFVTDALSAGWLLPAALGFVGLVLWHESARREHARAERGAEFYARGLARLDLSDAPWGNTGERHLDPAHPYALHLDLFGRRSLFELLSQAQTTRGEERLAAWLLAPAAPDEVRARQAAVAELAPRLALREDLFALGRELGDSVAVDPLIAWALAPRRLGGTAWRAGAAALAAATIAALLVGSLSGVGWSPFMLTILATALVLALTHRRVDGVIAAIAPRLRDLDRLASLLARLEAEPYEAPRLRAARAALDHEGRSASRQIAQLHRLVAVLDWRRNQLFAPIALLLMWGLQVAFALEAWRARSGGDIARWLDAIGDFEALGDLAGYAFEHAADPFPEIAEGGPLFRGRALGHPLLLDSLCVRNDLDLDAVRPLLVVSGSNMSGKSTFLRCVGTAALMALAGAPVRAEALALSPLALGACLRVQDSLRDGASRFYAELLALRRVTEQTRGALPVFFLLDEILAGTNSHDRRIGADALLKGLLARGAIGLVTTHDLALCAVADELAPRAANAHFEDQLENGTLRFDYRLRPGVIQRGNALELMRAVGLDLGPCTKG